SSNDAATVPSSEMLVSSTPSATTLMVLACAPSPGALAPVERMRTASIWGVAPGGPSKRSDAGSKRKENAGGSTSSARASDDAKAMTKSGPKSDARILMCRIPSQSVASAKKKIVGFERDAPGAGAETREHGRSSVKGSGGGFDGNFGGRRPRGAKRAGRITQVRLPESEAA